MTSKNPHFTQLIAAAAKVSPYARELTERVPSVQLGIVADTEDPANLRRITVTLRSKGITFTTDWLRRVQIIPYTDPPLPKPGTDVLVCFVDDDPHNGFWIGPVHNDTNPQDVAQNQPIDDHSAGIPGNDNVAVVGDRTRTTHGNQLHDIRGDSSTEVKGAIDTISKEQWHRSEQNFYVESGQKMRLQNDASAAIQLTETGDITLQNIGGSITLTVGGTLIVETRTGQKITIASGGSYEIDLAGHSLNLINAADVTINGHQVAVVGAKDDDGDNLINRGY